MKKIKTLQYTPSDKARTVINILRLPGESDQMCLDRLIGNLAVIAYGRENYEEHFGPQVRAPIKQVRGQEPHS